METPAKYYDQPDYDPTYYDQPDYDPTYYDQQIVPNYDLPKKEGWKWWQIGLLVLALIIIVEEIMREPEHSYTLEHNTRMQFATPLTLLRLQI
jgi:hypothetical protein